MADITGLTKERFSHSELLKAFPTREQRLEQMAICMQNFRRAADTMEQETNLDIIANLQAYCFLMHLVMKRIYDINEWERKGELDRQVSNES